MVFFLTTLRRRRLRRRPLPEEWRGVLQRRVPYLDLLSPGEKGELGGHLQVLVEEKNWEGCGGLEMTAEVQVVVSAQAALLLLNRRTDYFPRLLSILVYPTAFAAPRLEHRADGTVLEGREDLLGESWEHGTLVLAWDEVLRGAAHPGDGFNLVIHEFAHQLDSEWGHLEGAPGMGCPRKLAAWARVFRREYDRLVEQVEQGRRTFLDEYGATHPAEFFAVAVEAFFEQPLELEVNHPELHEQLKGFFHQDPGRRFQQEERPV